MARDWNALKAEYVAGTMSYRELAEKHNIPPSTLMKAATKGKWREGRTKYGESLVAEAVKKTQGDKIKKLQRAQQAADIVSSRILEIVEDPEQFHRHLIQVGLGDGRYETQEVILKAANTKALRDVVSALKDMAIVLRNLYGILTAQELESLEMARARLELDRQRAGTPSDAEGPGVIVLPAPDDEQEGQTD